MTSTITQIDDFIAIKSCLTGRTIYVNQKPDRYLISPEFSQEEVRRVVAIWENHVCARKLVHRPPPPLRKAIVALGNENTPLGLSKALDRVLLTEYLHKFSTTSIQQKQNFVIELMLALWSVGAVAWPTHEQVPFTQRNSIQVNNLGFIGPQREWLARVRNYVARGVGDDASNFRFILDTSLSRAGITEIGDITPQTFKLSKDTVRGKLRGPGINAVLQCLREDYKEQRLTWIPDDFGFFKDKMGHLARDDDFNWLLKQAPDMEQWVRLAKEHIATKPANWKKRKSVMNVFLQHIMENEDISRDPSAYFNIYDRPKVLFNAPGNEGRKTMSVLHEFLNETLFKTCTLSTDLDIPVLKPGFAVPIPRQAYRNVNKGETHRETMPMRLIRQAMGILTENDFAWARNVDRHHDSFRSRNPETGNYETVWSPVRTYALMIKLLLPARTFQVRCIDSGEGDTWRYHSDGRWVTNEGPHKPASPKIVQRGIFRKYLRKDGSEGAIFYFNTNKTADIDSMVKGYVMPWEKPDALQIFAAMRDWQERFNPVNGATPWSEIPEMKDMKHEEDLTKLGENFFLFRDPCHRHRPDLPVSDVRIRRMWFKLLEELEVRLARAGEKMPNGEPIKLILSRNNKGGRASSAVFDLHTLRVTLITAMYEEGVPPEYLMKIVGHATVLMTLYYTKINIETLSLRMNEALLERQRKAQIEMAGFLQKASRKELDSFAAYRNPAGLDALYTSTGSGMVVMDHGICPVSTRRCHEGLVFNDPTNGTSRYQPVPGGATNCVRCRFFITGPAFLLGLEAHVNDLSYRLKKRSYAFEKAQDLFDTISDEYAAALDSGEPFHRQRDLEVAETAFEAATAEVDAIALSLQAAYSLTELSIRITSQQSKSDELVLVAAGGLDHVEAVLSESHEFEQVQRICMGATFYDGLNINWQLANLERARFFDRMLRANGLEPRFSLLNDDDALKIANAMGQFLYARIEKDSVHALIDGDISLCDLGLDKQFVSQLDNLVPRTLQTTLSKQQLLEVVS
ncbi:hypothetical protein GEOBRER4_n1994 [Citrifermentans bremense]|uniref:Tyr recombinase domain-containing protein n=1 Tax=Citrifermentans bremense TaxID=60035 RepID=A0A6S6LYL6_9BACT|nr:VPA1269 family protein [Citrifermentans bremense]BCG47167.1 hypothetical protein GEOBRER4_n1994 [Citrifermentans bremense]